MAAARQKETLARGPEADVSHLAATGGSDPVLTYRRCLWTAQSTTRVVQPTSVRNQPERAC
jgi:hypothetical protein